MQAALGCAQLEQVDKFVADRQRIYEGYQKHLRCVPGVTLQRFAPDVDPVVWAIAATLDPVLYPQGRDSVMRQMQEAGVETRNGFYAASMMPHLYSTPALPICESLARNVISFPTYCSLTDADIEFVCSRLARLRK
jgi:perosamine synthetase